LIVVDTSVWIDFLNGSQSAQSIEMHRLIRENERVLLTGHVMVEILQGYSSKAEADQIGAFLLEFPFLDPDNPIDYVAAADLYRTARTSGITLRSTVDVLIAIPCIRVGAWLFHNDRDFDNLATVSDLKIWPPESEGR
jgi:predicted nucleic acid-binding protein